MNVTRSIAVAGMLALTVALCMPVRAQWPIFPESGVPRNADGSVNLDAPTPRTADGKPDLSGMWDRTPCIDCPPPEETGRGRGGDGAAGRGRGRGGRGRQGGGGASTFGNIGGGLPDGTAPYQPWAAELVKERMANNSKDNPDANCLPMGITQLNAHPFPRKLIQTPAEMVIIYEGSGTTVRELFLDGRTPPAEPDPWWNGYSTGHWEGDTLVVETVGLRDDGWLDVRGSPMTSAGKLIERFRRPRYGYLELEETIDDPKAYTRPFTAKLYYKLAEGTQLMETICIDRSAEHYVGAEYKK